MNAVTTQPPNQPREQRFIQTGVSWEGFKAIQKGFAIEAVKKFRRALRSGQQ